MAFDYMPQDLEPKRKGSGIFRFTVEIILIVVFVFTAMAISYYFGQLSVRFEQPPLMQGQKETTSTGETSAPTGIVSTTVDSSSNTKADFTVLEKEKIEKFADKFTKMDLPDDLLQNITWKVATEIKNPKFFNYIEGKSDPNLAVGESYYDKGTFEYKGNTGQIIYVYDSPGLGETYYFNPFFILNFGGKHIVLTDDKNLLLLADFEKIIDFKDFYLNQTLVVPLSKYPKNISTGQNRQTLVYPDYNDYNHDGVGANISVNIDKTFPKSSLVKYATIAGVGDIYQQKNDWGGDYYLFGADKTYANYRYTPDFINEAGVPQIFWSDGTKNERAYYYRASSGCGGYSGNLNVIPADEAATLAMTQIGLNSKNDPIFAFKDSKIKYLKDYYDINVGQNGDNKIGYDEFIASKPAFLWKSPFGDLIIFYSSEFIPAAECGKPVIYLYPETTTHVKVNLQLSRLSYSEPVYGSGWEVIAEPSGQLTEVKSGQKYPYLFWEGKGIGEYNTPEKGFVVARADLDKFFSDKLGQLGLIAKEISDFKEYWLPKMSRSPYYFVSFIGTVGMNKLAPLQVEPKPDTVIRILMDYKPLQKPVKTIEPQLSALDRQGFTVVEWGGVLGRE